MVVLTNEKMVFRGTEDNMEYLFRANTVMDALNKISEYLDSKKQSIIILGSGMLFLKIANM